MELTAAGLVEIAFDAFELEPPPVPRALRDRILAASAHSKPANHPGWARLDGRGVTSQAAFTLTAAELGDLLGTLTAADWDRPTALPGGPVREVVAHLVGIERYVLGQLGQRPLLEAPRREDHYAMSRRASADLIGVPGPELAARWWAEVMAVSAACGELGPDHPVVFHHLAGTIRGLLVVRTFELWTHTDDICRATGRPLSGLDAGRLSLMSSELLAVLPFGMGMQGTARPGRTARILLTGPGGGRYDTALAAGSERGEPDITITASTLDVCRLAANRLPIGELDAVVEGDRSLLEPILVGATAFAAD